MFFNIAPKIQKTEKQQHKALLFSLSHHQFNKIILPNRVLM